MKFRYPLQKIVDLKESEKSMAEWEYASAIGNLRKEEHMLETLRREREEAERRLFEQAQRPTALSELQRMQQTIEWLDKGIRKQIEIVRQAERQTAERRDRLTDKMVDEKVWHNARDKALQRFRHEALQREQNELDEMAIMRSAAAARG
ncbi:MULTISPECIES: flagellar export protein FliJ [Cohnella]|mgnify:CR=1 FL=1|uniref:flagellar export protein FliJ n=1 Tax=Cohnella TaxID=329857 RepID=UPI00111A317E|nr:flagellar export protein FliJ [Cohnella massiliensis]MBN2983598.1 flagellar export protein FliJ [Cohnella algarum]